MVVRRGLQWNPARMSRFPLGSLFAALIFAGSLTPGYAFGRLTANAPAQTGALPSQRGLQRPGRRGPRTSSIDKRVARLGTQLGLNDVQRFDLKKLLETEQAESNQLWNNQEIDPIVRMTKLRNLQEGTQKRFTALLTEGQRKKYEELRRKVAQAAAQSQATEKNLH